MATQATFSFVYDLGFTSADGSTVYPSSTAQSSFLEDNSDGLDDGQTANNASAFYDVAGFAVPIDGVTSNGEPVIQFNGRNLILSNNPSLTGNIGFVDNGAFIYCFLGGTAIATPDGEAMIEDLRSGDRVLTHDGRAATVTWVGQQKVMTRFRMPDRVRPVVVAKGALGNGVPYRDLYVTPDHAFFFDDILINASALVNDISIYYAPLSIFADGYIVYHIETELHEVIIAEGALAETFVDYGLRSAFDNFADYPANAGSGPVIAELPYPRISSARLVPDRVRRKLEVRQSA